MNEKQFDGRQKVMLGFSEAAAERGQHLYYVLIPESLGPMEGKAPGVSVLGYFRLIGDD